MGLVVHADIPYMHGFVYICLYTGHNIGFIKKRYTQKEINHLYPFIVDYKRLSFSSIKQ
jgi:hypothetical protein